MRFLLRVPKYFLLALLLTALPVGDVLRLNPAQQAAIQYSYSLTSWEARNLLSKWTHRAVRLLPWSSRPSMQGRELLDEYFRLGEEVRRLLDDVEEAAAGAEAGVRKSLVEKEDELTQTMEARGRLRNDVEELIESAISAVLTELDIASFGDLDYPPVDIRLDEPPRVLVTSPRDRIARSHEALVATDVTVEEREMMERALRDQDLSALVSNIGGVATYPAIVGNLGSLRWTLGTSAHEWMHHYLVANLKPLGLKAHSAPEMLTINETMVDMAGREIGDLAFERLGGAVEPPSPGAPEYRGAQEPERDGDGFDFGAAMRETRLRVDDLLAAGAIQEAEEFMEAQRLLFVENGFHIRKLNQAYFAINGTYAEQPQSSSPVGDQMREVRSLVPNLKTFISTMSAVSSHREFLRVMDRLREGGPP
jgi:hypothetical protein